MTKKLNRTQELAELKKEYDNFYVNVPCSEALEDKIKEYLRKLGMESSNGQIGVPFIEVSSSRIFTMGYKYFPSACAECIRLEGKDYIFPAGTLMTWAIEIIEDFLEGYGININKRFWELDDSNRLALSHSFNKKAGGIGVSRSSNDDAHRLIKIAELIKKLLEEQSKEQSTINQKDIDDLFDTYGIRPSYERIKEEVVNVAPPSTVKTVASYGDIFYYSLRYLAINKQDKARLLQCISCKGLYFTHDTKVKWCSARSLSNPSKVCIKYRDNMRTSDGHKYMEDFKGEKGNMLSRLKRINNALKKTYEDEFAKAEEVLQIKESVRPNELRLELIRMVHNEIDKVDKMGSTLKFVTSAKIVNAFSLAEKNMEVEDVRWFQ